MAQEKISTVTTDDIKRYEDNKKSMLARYSQIRTELGNEKERLHKANKEAIREGELDKALDFYRATQEIELKEAAINEAIEECKHIKYYTDADCVTAANEGAGKYLPTIKKLQEKFDKQAHELCATYKELALEKQKAMTARDEALQFHSLGANASLYTLTQQGLKDIPNITDANKIYGLLYDEYGAQAGAMRTIALGTSIPSFRG